MAISFVCYLNRVCIATAGDTRIMTQYGISPERMGEVYSAFLLTYTLGMIPGGLLIDRIGARALLTVLVGSSVFVALTGVIGLTISGGFPAFLALLVVRGLMGIVSAPLYPSCAAAIGHWVPAPSRSRANGLVNGSALIGVAITPLVFGALIDRVDWPAAFLIAACVTLALAAVWYVFVGTEHEQRPRGDGDTEPHGKEAGELLSWWSLLKDRGLLLLTISYGAVNYFQYLFFYWMNYYFRTVLELPVTRSRAYAAIPPLAMAVGMPLGGWLTDRLEIVFGRRRGRKIVPMAGMLSGAGLLMLGVCARSRLDRDLVCAGVGRRWNRRGCILGDGHRNRGPTRRQFRGDPQHRRECGRHARPVPDSPGRAALRLGIRRRAGSHDLSGRSAFLAGS